MSFIGNSKVKVVFRLSHMGDVTLTTGVLSHWHEKNGDTFVFITRAENAPLLANHPAISEVIALEEDVLKGKAWLNEARRLAAAYKGHPLIDLHGTLRSRILSLVWRGKVRRYPKFGLMRRLYDLTHAERFRIPLEAINVPQRYCMALEGKPPAARDLVPNIHITDAERAAASVHLKNISRINPLVALHPYATHPAKQWPREHWQGLTARLAGAGMDWFIVGYNDEPLFANHDRDFTNKTTLRETCALMEKADLLITGDSGPMHLATSVGTPVAALFGPTAKAWGFYPSGPEDRVLELDLDCRPCSLHGSKMCSQGYECLIGMTPEYVVDIARHMLDI